MQAQTIEAQSPVQPHPTDVEADDDEGPVITFQPNRLLRRSTSQHCQCQRDFGPVIRFWWRGGNVVNVVELNE